MEFSEKTQEYINKLEKRHPNRYSILSDYIGNYEKIKYRCNLCENIYEKNANYIYRKNVGCQGCRIKEEGHTDEWFQNKFYNQFSKEKYKVLGKYITSKTNLDIKHLECGTVYSMKPANIKGCPLCSKTPGKKIDKDIVFERYLQKVEDPENYILIHDELYDNYQNNTNYLRILHSSCGNISEKTGASLSRGSSCKYCGNKSIKIYNTGTFKNFIDDISDDNNYTLLSEYINTHTPVTIRHDNCQHEFDMSPTNFITKMQRCPKCAYENTFTTEEEFLSELKEKYNDEYILIGKYKGPKEEVLLHHNVCQRDISIKPYNLLNRGFTCRECYLDQALKFRSNNDFIEKIHDIVLDEYKFLENYKTYDTPIKCNHLVCGNSWNITPRQFIENNSRCPECHPIIRSYEEMEVVEFMKEIYNGEVIESDRSVLEGKRELDIYLPELGIAIEYNGLYWHSEYRLDDAENYHLSKTKECHEKNIRLIHIYSDEWMNKKEIVKSKIRHILGLNNNRKIYARKCYIKEIDTTLKNDFLEKNHIQGKDISSIRLGLFEKDNDNLVSVMTFSKLRRSTGHRHIDDKYELVRFASSDQLLVIGAFGKLLTYFKNNYTFTEIITYADLRWSSLERNVYDKNNFNLSHISKPSYDYVHVHGGNSTRRFNRYSFRKSELKSKFPDLYDYTKTEKEIMQEAGYERIWNCGNLVFSYKNQ